MKIGFKNLLVVFSFFLSIQSHAGLIGDGGMSGGGGGTVVTNPAGPQEIDSILFWARQGLYLYFNKLSMYPHPMEPRIDFIKNKIQAVISNTDIYAASTACKDKFGAEVDGSMYSPKPHSICISLKNLGEKLTKDNARPQTIALVAHEYAHLLGFNEEDAEFVQNWVLSSFTDISQAQSYNVVKQSQEAFSSLQMTINEAAHFEYNLTWNSACYYASQIDQQLRKINDDGENGSLSLFNTTTFKARNSYYIKAIAFKEATCGLSDYYPSRESYKRDYPLYFGGKSQVTDTELQKFILIGDLGVLGTVNIRKITSLDNALAELADLNTFATEKMQELEMLKGLNRPSLK